MKHLSISIIGMVAALFLFTGCFSMMNLPDEPFREGADIGKRDEVEKAAPLSTEGLKNFLSNPGFENGAGKWVPFGYCTVELSTAAAHSGSNSLFVTNRLENWEGAGVDMLPIFKKGSTYIISAWVMLENSSSSPVKITVKRITNMGENYDQVLATKIEGNDWVEIMGEYIVDPSGSIESMIMYIEGLPPGNNFYIDDVKVVQIGPKKIYEGDTIENTTEQGDTIKTTETEENISTGPIKNPGFEDSIQGWNAFGTCNVEQSTAQAHSGKKSIYVSDRTGDWNGAATNVTAVMKQGKSYKIGGWVFLENAASAPMRITILQTDGAGESFNRINTVEVVSGKWVQLSGEFTVTSDSVTDLVLYFEGPQPDVNYYIDDVTLEAL